MNLLDPSVDFMKVVLLLSGIGSVYQQFSTHHGPGDPEITERHQHSPGRASRMSSDLRHLGWLFCCWRNLATQHFPLNAFFKF